MNANEIRQKFIQFYQSKNHASVPSSSLVPDNDPTTLFTSSGMQPMMPYLQGQTHPLGTKLVDSQRCFRSEDIEEVGDNRHTTAFEMLGNWSFGDYFKQEQLNWFYQFLTQDLEIDPNKLYVSVFSGNDQISPDQEAIQIWQDIFAKSKIEAKVISDAPEKGLQNGRIFVYGEKKNWWSRSGPPSKMPVSEPGGPDSEVFYEFTQIEHDFAYGEHCHPNCDCGRFLEIGNNVFMQYQKQTDGTFQELTQKNIDFGGGVERIVAAKNNEPDVFKTDLFLPIILQIEKLTNLKYSKANEKQFRIIADHLKASVWLISDGVIPSNKTQGYVLRRLLRRSIGAGRIIGIEKPFLAELATTIQEMYKELYPQVNTPQINQTILEEEQKFSQTLQTGLNELHKYLNSLSLRASEAISEIETIKEFAQNSFNFYQSYGLPSDIFIDELDSILPTKLSVDNRLEIQKQFEVLFHAHQQLSRASSANMFKGGLADQSEKVTQYHTLTHLLHQALRDVLGEHVQQRGSNITSERLRFDFSHSQRLSPKEITKVEQIVNSKIQDKLPVYFQTLPIEQARNSGAIGLFGEKYPDIVKVYSIGKQVEESEDLVPRTQVYSREFCGGPHVSNTSEIQGTFKIQKDEKLGKDVVRIKAVLV